MSKSMPAFNDSIAEKTLCMAYKTLLLLYKSILHEGFFGFAGMQRGLLFGIFLTIICLPIGKYKKRRSVNVVHYVMKVILILSSIFLLCSCKNASTKVQVQKDTAAILHTSVDSQSDYFKQIANRMDLYIPTVKDSFMFRLWINSLIEPDHVIELRKSGKDWDTRKFIYYFEPDGRLMFKEVPLELLSTLAPIIDSLDKVNFNSLISQEQIKGFQDNVADGETYNMEIFQSGHYKILAYHCPETYYSKEENNKKFVDILMLLEKHFTFYSPICKRG